MNPGFRFTTLLVLLAIAFPGWGQAWVFGNPVDVSKVQGEGVFHHLESSGRRNIALSGPAVALTWEDDHDGLPRVYLARKALTARRFDDAVRISGGGEAFEPGIAALSGGRFVIAWEEDAQVYARIAGVGALGPPLRLSRGEAAQASVAVSGDRVFVVRSEREGRWMRIRLRTLRVAGELRLVSEADCVVDSDPLQGDQYYPSPALLGGELVVAWEDRRAGHTIIMAAVSKLDTSCGFSSPQRISHGELERNLPYGKGHGVSRVALASTGGGLFGVWADKRNFREGYDIYGTAYLGQGRFGDNQRVQDDFAGQARQWHPAIAGESQGRTLVAWTDEREGDSDILLSWSEEGGWSEDMPLPGASGPGEQTHPSIVLGADGGLHAAWIERQRVNGPTRLRYAYGRVFDGQPVKE
ncbi:MAG: hypothetical protein KZQ95_09240 [Candidatus Thiodiazotropha sp. (ex Epidulcina cf. delphinae)]|nr:hypothetical protein [Candidatus Thiodiazotropha sp. (ex Epidulcina cf. delphinae)]